MAADLRLEGEMDSAAMARAGAGRGRLACGECGDDEESDEESDEDDAESNGASGSK